MIGQVGHIAVVKLPDVEHTLRVQLVFSVVVIGAVTIELVISSVSRFINRIPVRKATIFAPEFPFTKQAQILITQIQYMERLLR